MFTATQSFTLTFSSLCSIDSLLSLIIPIGSASMSIGTRGVVPPGYLDSDTRLSGGSWAAARAAAGAAIAAVNLVMDGFGNGSNDSNNSGNSGKVNAGVKGAAAAGAKAVTGAEVGAGVSSAGSEGGQVRRAFVCGRPPGHHAGPRGCVANGRHFWRSPDMCSCGFCLFNNAAIAAAYARNK